MRILLSIAVCLLLAACSSPSTPPHATPGAQAAASAPHVDTPWDGLLKDRDKAKAVQQKMDAYTRRQQQAIDRQGR